jgi:hypothetical protein
MRASGSSGADVPLDGDDHPRRRVRLRQHGSEQGASGRLGDPEISGEVAHDALVGDLRIGHGDLVRPREQNVRERLAVPAVRTRHRTHLVELFGIVEFGIEIEVHRAADMVDELLGAARAEHANLLDRTRHDFSSLRPAIISCTLPTLGRDVEGTFRRFRSGSPARPRFFRAATICCTRVRLSPLAAATARRVIPASLAFTIRSSRRFCAALSCSAARLSWSENGTFSILHARRKCARTAGAAGRVSHGGISSMSDPQGSPLTFTRAELEALAEGLAILIAENPDHDPAQRAMAKVRTELRKLNTDEEEE